jgi:glucose-1-phosphate adenylyltransferase
VILGNDLYESADGLAAEAARGLPPLGIGDGSIIEGAIVDKNVHIGRRVRIVNEHHWTDTADCPRFMVRDGVAVVPRGAIVPDGWIPEPGLVKQA